MSLREGKAAELVTYGWAYIFLLVEGRGLSLLWTVDLNPTFYNGNLYFNINKTEKDENFLLNLSLWIFILSIYYD